jgi:flagellar basal-body rod modification protein FlgD
MTTISERLGASTSLGAPATQSTQSNLGPDAFMRLLVTQIKNQDPAKPMDTTEMMAQLSQMTQVERLVAIDQRLQSLQVANAAIANTQAVDLVGTTVEADTSRMILNDLGPGQGAFQLDGAAATVKVEIRDDNGDLVRTLELGPQASGTKTFDWDGNTDEGERAPSGRYSISVTAKTGEGMPVTTRTSIRGPVHSISYADGYPALSIGDAEVLMGDVRNVSSSASYPTTSSGSSSGSGTSGSSTSGSTASSSDNTSGSSGSNP